MGINRVLDIGISGMNASKAAITTTGHNIANANTEGYSRQRVVTEAKTPEETGKWGGLNIGNGANVSRIERVNDEYIEKQIRNSGRDLSHFEEKDVILRQTEDIFNEMNGEGLNRIMSRFFNEFRKLANEPDSEAVRQSVREASTALVNDFHRLRSSVEEIRQHIDAKIEGYAREVTSTAKEIRDLNININKLEAGGMPANDLEDKRDKALKKIAEYMDIATHKDRTGQYVVDIRGVGPFIGGERAEEFYVEHSPADRDGKPENALDLMTTANANAKITHAIKGGKFGALIEVRDQVLSKILDRLDDLALGLSQTVNEIHQQGFTRNGFQGVDFFKAPQVKERAAEYIDLSDAVKENANHIAAAAEGDAPGDNRIAIAVAGLQGSKLMNNGTTTADDWYNSIVSDVGVASSKNRANMSQQKDIMTHLAKIHEQISGVSIDEETANLMQFQHAFDASAKVIQVADEMLKTVLDLKR